MNFLFILPDKSFNLKSIDVKLDSVNLNGIPVQNLLKRNKTKTSGSLCRLKNNIPEILDIENKQKSITDKIYKRKRNEKTNKK